MGLTRVTETMSIRQAREGLTNLLSPSNDGGWRDVYRSGWLPAGFNQQWGGTQWGTELIDGVTGQVSKFDVATGNVQVDSEFLIGYNTPTTGRGMRFRLAEAVTSLSIWIKCYKVGVPTFSNTQQICADSAGNPGTVLSNYTTSEVYAPTMTGNPNGEWYKVSFTVSLAANTDYWFVVKDTGAVSTTNYLAIKGTSTTKMPNAKTVGWDGTTYTADTSSGWAFLIENQTGFLQPSGQFNKKLVFNEANSITQHKALCQPVSNFFDGSKFTYLIRGKDFAKGKPICDFIYGLDHDRFVLIPDASTGLGSLKFYDKAGTLFTVNGTTDLSTSVFKDIAIVVRTMGDTGDYLQLWVNGVKQGEIVGQALNLDSCFKDLGTAWLGGGFPLTPTWSTGSLSTFSTLPSGLGWAWTGTATEANAMSVANGRLFKCKNGYTSTQSGYYSKSSLGLNNTNGWVIEAKTRNTYPGDNPTNIFTSPNVINFSDGTKTGFLEISTGHIKLCCGTNYYYQGDFSSKENVFIISAKGPDIYVFVNGKLVIDGTGGLTSASASNNISFGDTSVTAGENSDSIWSYIKLYNTANIIPIVSTGSSISEAAYWSGDKSLVLLDLYGAGNPVSVKTYCGLSNAYVNDGVINKEDRVALTSTVTTTSTTNVLVPDMETYTFGSDLKILTSVNGTNNTASAVVYVGSYIDGVLTNNSTQSLVTSGVGVPKANIGSITGKRLPLGLHKVEIQFYTSGAATASIDTRVLKVESKS